MPAQEDAPVQIVYTVEYNPPPRASPALFCFCSVSVSALFLLCCFFDISVFTLAYSLSTAAPTLLHTHTTSSHSSRYSILPPPPDDTLPYRISHHTSTIRLPGPARVTCSIPVFFYLCFCFLLSFSYTPSHQSPYIVYRFVSAFSSVLSFSFSLFNYHTLLITLTVLVCFCRCHSYFCLLSLLRPDPFNSSFYFLSSLFSLNLL